MRILGFSSITTAIVLMFVSITSESNLLGYLLTAIILLVVGVVLMNIASKNEPDEVKVKKQELTKEEKFDLAFNSYVTNEIREDINSDKFVPLHTGGKYYFLDPEKMKFVFLRFTGEGYDRTIKDIIFKFEHRTIDLTKVKQLSLKTDDKIVGNITKEGGIGRAVVGGLLFGGAGAVVGSATAKERTIQSNLLVSIELEIVTTDLVNPYSTVFLYSNEDFDTDFSKMEYAIKNMYWSLENTLQQEKTSNV